MEGAPAGDEELEVPLVSQAVQPVAEKTVSCKCKSSCSQVQNAAEFRVSFVHRFQRLPAPEKIPFQPDMPGIRGRHCQRTRTTATVSETHCFLLVSLSKQSSSSTMWSSPCSRGVMVRMLIQIWILRVQLYSQLYAVQLKNQVWKKTYIGLELRVRTDSWPTRRRLLFLRIGKIFRSKCSLGMSL